MKRKMTTCFATLVVLFFTAGLHSLYAGETIEKVLVDKQFDVNRGVQLTVSHEFGDVYCKNWDQPNIAIKITARVTARNEAKAEEIIGQIKAAASGDSKEVSATCKLRTGKNDGSQKIEITMEIMMPAWVNLKLDHSFGSAYVGDVSGNTNIESQYGEFVANSLSGTTNELNFSFGKATIEDLSEADIELSYGNLKLKKANNLAIESDFSDVEIGQLITLKGEFSGGGLTLNSVSGLDIETEFSNVTIDQLLKYATLEMSYGGVQIKNVAADFSQITLSSEFSSSTLHIDSEASYRLEMNSEFGQIGYPESKAQMVQDIKSDFAERRIKANVGDVQQSKSSIIVNSTYGSVKVN